MWVVDTYFLESVTEKGQRTDLSTDQPTESKTTTASDRKSVATGRFGPLLQKKISINFFFYRFLLTFFLEIVSAQPRGVARGGGHGGGLCSQDFEEKIKGAG